MSLAVAVISVIYVCYTSVIKLYKKRPHGESSNMCVCVCVFVCACNCVCVLYPYVKVSI